MNLLFVLEYYPPHIGGVEVLFKNLCERLAELGHKITVITSQIENSSPLETLNGVQIHRIKTPNRYLFTFFAIPKAIALAKSADVIHTTTYNGAFPAWLCAKIRRKPVVITIHEVWIGKWREYTQMSFFSAHIHNFLERMIYFLSFNYYIGVSNSTRDALLKQGIPPKRTKTILNGFDSIPWKTQEDMRLEIGLEGKYVVIGYGRPGISKGFSYLLDATPAIKKKIPNAEILLMLSTSPAFTKQRILLEEKAKKVGARILESLPYKDLPKFVNSADCVVIPSLTEGFGYVVVESCTLEKAVVASNIASIPEVIFGKGKLVKPKDASAIANGVLEVHAGKTDFFARKNLSWKTNIEKHEAVYFELCKKEKK